MAVAVKNDVEKASGQPLNRLAVSSLAGTLYVLGSLAVVFYALPSLWEAAVTPTLAKSLGVAVDAAVKILVMVAAFGGLAILGKKLVGVNAPHGLRAGIAVGIIGLLAIALLGTWVGAILEGWAYKGLFGSSGKTVGAAVNGILTAALLFFALRYFFRPKCEETLKKLEDQGWFSAASYKSRQGIRVRRGTIIAVLGVFGCGVGTLLIHHTLESGPNNWELSIPFTGTVQVTDLGDGKALGAEAPVAKSFVDRFELRDLNERLLNDFVRVKSGGKSTLKADEVVKRTDFEAQVKLHENDVDQPKKTAVKAINGPTAYKPVTIIPHLRYTLPILLSAFALWFGFRLVNFPPFADFLIATEAELNKVSWTTRKRLVQDTIVVLTTMILITIFLFVVDLIWFYTLSNRYVGVLLPANQKADVAHLDEQIETLKREQSDAITAEDSKKAEELSSQIDQLTKARDAKLRSKADDSMDW